MTLDNSTCRVDLSKVVFVTNSLGGHRLTWFLNLHKLQVGFKQPVQIIFSDEFPSSLREANILQVHKAETNREAILVAESLFKQNDSLVFIFLDGEQWIRHLINTQFPARILIMRPFVSAYIISAILKFPLKFIALGALNLKRNIEIHYLAIPYYKPIFRRNKWVNDNLTTSDVSMEYLSPQVSQEPFTILIPGFINERKKPNYILKIAADLEAHFPNQFRICFLGTIDQSTKKMIDSSFLANVSYQDKYFSRDEYVKMIREADLILLLYTNRSASGIVMEALALNKRVFMQKSNLWVNLQKVSYDRMIFISSKREKILTQFLSFVHNKQPLDSFTPSPSYDFLNKDDPKGLIHFIFRP